VAEELSVAAIMSAVADVQRKLADTDRPARCIYVRRDMWPALKAQLVAKKAETYQQYMEAMWNGVAVFVVVDWLPVTWCTDVDIECVSALAAYRERARKVPRG